MASGKQIVAFGLLGVMTVSLFGFGTVGFSGGMTNVASVGDEEISANTYATALSNQINVIESQTGQPLTALQAVEFGLGQQVLEQLLSEAALNGETTRIGLSVGDEAVRRELLAMDAFKGIDGSFDTATYKDLLRRNNLKEQDFEADLRQSAARDILTAALATGVTMPPAYGQVVVDWLGERRTVSVAILSAENLETGTPIASESDILSWYDTHPEAYTAPEARRITYAWLTPAMLSDKVDLDENALLEIYNANIDSFVQPERRLVERLVFSSSDEAAAAAARIETGETSFEDEVSARGLDLLDVDMGDVSKTELGSAADDVFALEGTGVVGPVETDLGPALFRVNGTFEGTEVPFEEAREEIARQMSVDAATRLIADQIELFDNDLAEGYTLEELAAETDLELGTVDWTTESEAGIAAYTAFQQAAATVTRDDYPEIIELSDGGVFALRLDEIVDSAVKPLDEVRDQVAADFEADALTQALMARAEAFETDVAAGQPIAELGLPVETFDAITRQDFISTMPDGFMDAVFAPGLQAGGTTLIAGDGRVVIARLEAIEAPEETEDNAAIAESYIASAAQGAATDVIAAFGDALRARDGVTVNQVTLNAVHSQMQ
ncbi:peptidylprolyl isomerase [Celeribacter litoreus]|uniref:peptidylprolyl isomerase n=1 Tax=Celeribacter litoreus TaxID=2876714 RepID=UPI001CC9E700|nr:peptidylprolyl isomerase [Celeribacter litoreus]MCA0043563.1 SurA N-terminal domain-containing protein [Celeribacter litoreus]